MTVPQLRADQRMNKESTPDPAVNEDIQVAVVTSRCYFICNFNGIIPIISFKLNRKKLILTTHINFSWSIFDSKVPARRWQLLWTEITEIVTLRNISR